MASPQLENGYLRIAQQLVDQFCRRCFNGQEWRILWAVIRKTYGYNKREDAISLSQFREITGMDCKSVARTLKCLRIKNVLICKESRAGNVYKINKNFDAWLVAKLPLLDGGESASGETATGGVATPRKEGVATPCVEPGGETATHNKQIDNRQGTFEVSDLKTETENLKNLGWKDEKIHSHFLMRNIPEPEIKKALEMTS